MQPRPSEAACSARVSRLAHGRAVIGAVQRYNYGREFDVGLKVVLDAPLIGSCVYLSAAPGERSRPQRGMVGR
jgi:hypothetical protein